MKPWIKKLTAILFAASVAASVLALPVSAAWERTGSQWRYTVSGGYATGWRQVDGTWYYFNQSGIMQTGWQRVNGVWYYMDASGAMKTGWVFVDGAWYYLQGSGAMKTGWLQLNGIWYFLNGGGVMKTGWVNTGGHWYYMDSSGAMLTGWQEIGGKRYYFYDSGAMATGNVTVGGTAYRFDDSGALIEEEPLDTSSMAAELLREINTVRQKEGLSALSLSDALTSAAQARAREQALMGGISHRRPDGSEWYTILAEHGVKAAGSGENLAMNYTSVSGVVKAWLESPTHRSNIVNASYRYMGLGYYEADGNVYWVQLFASS